jgi:hypothetical protein
MTQDLSAMVAAPRGEFGRVADFQVGRTLRTVGGWCFDKIEGSWLGQVYASMGHAIE